MNLIYVPIAFLISSVYTNSSFLCDRFESPGPILIASHVILIQSEVVAEEIEVESEEQLKEESIKIYPKIVEE